jgi:acyl-CoA thioester hydrolase
MRHGSTLPVLETTVVSDWVDYNGHMNDAAYAIVFSRSIDALMDRVGLDAAARKRTGQSLFTLQMMLHYFKEAKEGDALAISCQLLEHDDKRMRVWLDMTAPGGAVVAASEQLLISVAQSDGSARAIEWSFETKAALEALAKAQSGLLIRPQPDQAWPCSGKSSRRFAGPTRPDLTAVKLNRGLRLASELTLRGVLLLLRFLLCLPGRGLPGRDETHVAYHSGRSG